MDPDTTPTPRKSGFQPPVTRGTHLLPFASLSPADFERLCLGLVCREGFERAEHLGAAGRDDGCDIVAFRRGRRAVFQCKRCEKLGPKDAEAIVDEILAWPRDQWPAKLILLATCNISAETRRRGRARALTIEFEVWAVTELDERIHKHPDLLARFFDVHSRVQPLGMISAPFRSIFTAQPPIRQSVFSGKDRYFSNISSITSPASVPNIKAPP
jgi:hypothetical protein